MTRITQISQLVKTGYNIFEIKQDFGVTFGSIRQYLFRAMREGLITSDEALLTIPYSERVWIEVAMYISGMGTSPDLHRILNDRHHHLEEDVIKIYLLLRENRPPLEELYKYISGIELSLHRGIKLVLTGEYGEHWWRKGIPPPIRKELAAKREEDPEPANEPYSYTTFIHLNDILNSQWQVFSRSLPVAVVGNKKELSTTLVRLNHIRNAVMHPVKGVRLTDEDLQFARNFSELIQLDRWQKLSG